MDRRPSSELLYDSEASLRLVDRALEELHLLDTDPDPDDPASLRMEMLEVHGGMAHLPRIVVQASCEIESLLDHLRESRDALERTAGAAQLPAASDSDPHDGLDRALELVDRLDGAGQSDERGRLQSDLRDVILGLAGQLDLSDVIDLRVSRAMSALREMEDRLSNLALHFDPQREDERSPPRPARPEGIPANGR